MPTERFADRWVGVGLAMVGATASIWLTATGKLTLYVHPRYTLLTVVMSIVALVAVVLAVAILPGNATNEPVHGHADRARSRQLVLWSRFLILGCAVFALLLLPPATLTAATRQNRDLVTSGQTLESADTTILTGGNSATFSVKDWAALLRQGGSEAVLGKKVEVSGYVLDQGRDDGFYVVRLMVSCCAVDAQPIGLPVHRPGWRTELRPSDWVGVEGIFVEAAAADSRDPVVVQVDALKKIAEPEQPYVF